MKNLLVERLSVLGLALALAGPVAAQTTIRWVPGSSGQPMAEAIGAGGDESNPVPYVCRGQVGADLIPGEVGAAGCIIATDAAVETVAPYEVPLGAKAYVWKPSSAGQALPSGAFPAGREGKTPLYVCRVLARGAPRVGRIRRDGCLIVEGGTRTTAPSYDVLAQVEAKSAQGGGKTFARRDSTPPPDCSKGVASVETLWPANHKMQMVFITGVPDPRIVSVFQDECVNGQGDGDTAPDAEIAGNRSSVQLRAERSGQGDGRVYHVRFTCSGGGQGEALVRVPKSQKETAVDGGALHDSTLATSPGCGGPTPTPPSGDCKSAAPSLAEIWPPSKKLTPVTLTGAGDYKITGVRQDECVGGKGGDDAPDATISGDRKTVDLRAERDGQGDGRYYHVSFTCDGGGSGVVKVAVPHDQGKPPVDQGPIHDSTATTSPACDGATPTPPPGDCGQARASVDSLWPPNHKMTAVSIAGVSSYRILSVKQDECVNGLGDGDTAPDAAISADGRSVELRAERAGGGNGRVYTILLACGAGQTVVKVMVPPSPSQSALDDGAKYDSTAASSPGCGGTATPTPTVPPGDCSKATASIAELWPPNHKLVAVTLQGVANARILAVLQDECVDGVGDGDSAPDAVIAPDGKSVELRAERSATADGRVYHVRFQTSTCAGEVKVSVVHDQGKGPAIDGGALYDSRATTTAGTNCTAAPRK